MHPSVAVTTENGASPTPLAASVAAAAADHAPALAGARDELTRRRHELAEAEAALAAEEEAARRSIEAAAGEWRAEGARRGLAALDRAAAWSIAAELADVEDNRGVVLATIHASLHAEIAEAFDRRIAGLRERAAHHVDLGDDPAPPEPVDVGAVWLGREPAVIGFVPLDLGTERLDDAIHRALVEIADDGGVHRADLGGGPHLVLRPTSYWPDAAAAAAALQDRVDELLRTADEWPPSARVRVEVLGGDAGRAIAGALAAPAGTD